MAGPAPPFKSVGDFIRTQRELMSLSMRQLAGLAKVSNPYLSQIERGVYTPSAQVLKGIADALDMSAETLYREAGLLDDSVERPILTVEDAIRVDGRLTQEAKQALIQVYRGLIATQQPSTDRSTPSRPARKTAAKNVPAKAASAKAKPKAR
jgi:transcriptional regulator with XRE-family HTH domain